MMNFDNKAELLNFAGCGNSMLLANFDSLHCSCLDILPT